jgi:hypothetical protein
MLYGAGVAAQDATPGAAVGQAVGTPGAEVAASPVAGAPAAALFVQTFTVGKLEPGAEAGTATLTLQGPDGETVYFGDQPGRFAGAVAFDNFVQILGQAAGASLPAAVIIDRPEGDQVVALELTDGTIDASGTLTYTVRLTDPSTLSTDLTQSAAPLTDVTSALDFGPSHLFVDTSQ